MGEIEVIKKELLDNIQNVLKEHEGSLDKKFITMDEFKQKIAEFQAKIEQASMNKEDGAKIFADYLQKMVVNKQESLTGDIGGSSLVPENVSNAILAELYNNWIMQDVTVFPDDKGILFYPSTPPMAQSVAVGTKPTEVDTQVIPIHYNTERAVIGQHVGRRLLEKANPKIGTWLLGIFGQGFNNYLQNKFVLGSGTNEPLGLYNIAGIPVYVLGTGKTTVNDITYADLEELWWSLPKQYRTRAVWYMASATAKAVFALKDSTGRPYFDKEKEEIFGRPVREVDDMDSSGTTNPVIFLGYPKDYILFTSGQFKTDIVKTGVDLIQTDQVYTQLTGYFDGKLATPNHFIGLKLAAA